MINSSFSPWRAMLILYIGVKDMRTRQDQNIWHTGTKNSGLVSFRLLGRRFIIFFLVTQKFFFFAFEEHIFFFALVEAVVIDYVPPLLMTHRLGDIVFWDFILDLFEVLARLHKGFCSTFWA